MITRPLYIENKVESQNYEDIVRKNMGSLNFNDIKQQAATLSNPHDFTELLRMSAEQEEQGGNSPALASPNSTGNAQGTPNARSTAQGTLVNAQGMPIAGTSSRGIPLVREGLPLYGENEKVVGIPLNSGTRNILGFRPTNGFPLDGSLFASRENVSQKPSEQTGSKDIDPTNAKEYTDASRNLLSGNSSTNKNLGHVSAQFESSNAGIEAIGYDRRGGTSYGKYQLSSKQGSVDNFIKYLKKHEPDFADRLSNAGPANTGNKNGDMPTEWKNIAREYPEKFEELQHNFVVQTYSKPVVRHLENKLGASLPQGLDELVFSTSIQHGVRGAKNIFDTILEKQGSEVNLSQFVEDTYELRGKMFSGSSSRVQDAVQSRFSQEEDMVLALLKDQIRLV